jgi:aryl sulfotransferase
VTAVPAPALAGTRVYQHHHLDSTRWDHVPYRADDIVITTPYKCGTTWTQRIVCALLHGPEQPVTREISPWIDARFWGPIEPIAEAANALPHRRFMKSHLALDGMRWDDRVRFVVVGRDTRDVFMSLLNHYGSYTDVALSRMNDGIRGEPLPRYGGDPHALWRDWISRGWFEWEEDGWPFWSHHHHLATWWTARDRPNVFLMHYADLKADPAAEIARLADFLGLRPTADELAEVVRVSSFDVMRQDAIAREAAAGGPDDGGIFTGGVATFMYKGTNGRWRDLLTDDELAQYEARAARLDPEFRAWLESGRNQAIALT